MKELCIDRGLDLRGNLDQHLLLDMGILRKLVNLARIGPDEVVLELGAGPGNLTCLLAREAKEVVAIEKDEDFLLALRQSIREFDNVRVLFGDAMRVHIPDFDKIVSNPPYSIVESLFWRLCTMKFRLGVLTVPSSFSHSLIARESDKWFAKLSFVVQLFFEIELGDEIPTTASWPSPRTESRIVLVKPHDPHDGVEATLRGVVVRRNRKTKNALREALIDATNGFPGIGCPNQRSARQCTHGMIPCLEAATMETRVSRLSLGQLLELSRTLQKRCT